MYIPWLLAQGKTLYRDVWYLHGPGAPYFNGFLFYCFGPRLAVLYWAGALAALSCAGLLFATALRFGFRTAGFTAGVVTLLQAFVPGIFCFALPYSYAAVYGSVAACLFMWCAVHAHEQPQRPWVVAAGLAAAVALLLKFEFGLGCYCALACLLAIRAMRTRSRRSLAFDLLAVAPGAALCAAVIAWMVSLQGVAFLTQQNLLSWPTSYFMNTYGPLWLKHTGFDISWENIARALLKTAILMAFWLLLRASARQTRAPLSVLGAVLVVGAAVAWKGGAWMERIYTELIFLPQMIFVLPVAVLAAVACYRRLSPPWRTVEILVLSLLAAGSALVLVDWPVLPFGGRAWTARIYSELFFPPQMVFVLLVALFAAVICRRRLSPPGGTDATLVLFVLATSVAFRHLFRISPKDYAIYYNGPVMLSFLLLMRAFLTAGRPTASASAVLALPCLGMLLAASFPLLQLYRAPRDMLPLVTERGVISVRAGSAGAHRAAIAIMKQKTRLRETIMSIPEDTSLYFLSGAVCPTRVFAFTPGTLAPGEMTDTQIRDIERARVQWLIWSNRTFVEYGSPVFGLTFDRPLGDYFRKHFRPLYRLAGGGEWEATVWQRAPQESR